MKKLVADLGGRPRANDDLMALQEMILTGSGGPILAGLPTCVVSGCTVTPAGSKYNVTAGLVWLGPGAGAASGLYDFAGAANVDLPGNFLLGATEPVDQRPYQTGGTKTCISDTKALLEGVDPSGPFAVDASGPLFWYDHLAARTRAVGTIEMGMFDLTGYSSTGQGLGSNRGWALCNGQNQTVDLQGRFPLAYNTDVPTLSMYALGTTGGTEMHTLSITEMPRHSHSATVDGPGDDNGANYGEFGALQNGKDRNNQFARQATTHSTGGSQPHNNMPPYLVLAFRQWRGFW